MVRVSKERDGMSSPEMQRTAIQQFADSNNIHIVDWVEGIDESGSDKKSAWWPRLDQCITRMEAGECDIILVWRFSRVGRQRLRWAIALDRVDTLGGSILAALEPIESATASGRFARGMLGEMNAYQSELLGEQWKETHERRRRAGLPHGGHHRFGYQVVDGRFEPDPVTGPILAEMYRRALRGDGAGRITRWLNESGILTTQGNTWVSTNLYQMLDGGFGAGLIVHRPGWKQKRLPKDRWTFSPGQHEAVITESEWAEYWHRRLARSEPSRVIEARHMLTGLLYCADCGGRMNYSHGRYVCVSATRAKGMGKLVVTMKAEHAEAAVTDWVMGLAADTDALVAARSATKQRRVRSVNDADAIRRKLAKAEQAMAALTIRQLDDDRAIPESAYQATIRKLEAEHASLSARQQSLELVNAQREVDVRTVATTLAGSWVKMDTHLRRQALQRVTAGIVIRPGRVTDRVIVVPQWEARA